MANTSLTTKNERIVQPAKGGVETRWLLLVALITLVCCGTAIGMRTGSNKEKEVESWQINAFEALNAAETGIFTALQAAALEIDETHKYEQNHWLEISELEDLFIAPFAKDASWHKQGELIWTKTEIPVEDRHIAVYLGHPQTEAVRGSFLLLILHDHKKKQGNVAGGPAHAPFEIWFHGKISQKSPTIISDQAFIAAGWKEVIGLTGQDEVTRMKGQPIK